ncbi:MBL fold metallo-hydrolase [Leifsonia kafniensis]|uniref:MBL fold metallo-hydrolase n=1 Tax=Leifsonia kafniensis TaxID=475957 RepID=A0ABP7KSJ8_9MICO
MALQITGTVQKQAWVDKTFPPIEQVRPLVWSVPISMHPSPVRYTLSYLVLNEIGECVVVDPGLDSDAGWEQLLDGLARAGSSLEAVVGIVATHLHADHLGMVSRLADITGAWIGMHRNEDDALEQRLFSSDPRAIDRAWLVRCGVPADVLDSLLPPPEETEYFAQLARPTQFLEHDAYLPLAGRRIRVVETPGHTQGHICLADEDSEVILTGDHILPRISPHVGLGARSGHWNALAAYYESLVLMHDWDAFEVCPAHEYRFHGLRNRAIALQIHHNVRAQEIIEIVTTLSALSLWEIAERLTWSRGWESLDGLNLRSALSETVAHVEHLSAQGTIVWGAPEQLAGSPWIARLGADVTS